MKFIAGLRVWVNGGSGKTPQVFPRFRGSANRRVDLHLPLIASISGRRQCDSSKCEVSRLGRVPPSAGRDVIDRKACFLSLLAQAAVWLLELRVSQHFSTFYGPSVQAIDAQLNAPSTLPVLARTVSGCLNSAFSRHFYTFYELSVQTMDTQVTRQRSGTGRPSVEGDGPVRRPCPNQRSTLWTRRLVVPSPPHPNPLPRWGREPEVPSTKGAIANSTVLEFRSALEHETANLRWAAVTIGVLAGQALAHVQERRSGAEEPPVEPARVDAGHEDGAKRGQPDLAAMVVTREHQVHAPVAGPVELVGRVAQQDPEIGRGYRSRPNCWPPGCRGAAQGQPRTVLFQRAPAPLERCESGIGQRAKNAQRLMLGI